MVRTFANGGNCLSLPDHTLESVLASVTSGADGLHVRVCCSVEGEPVLRRSSDLALSTNGSGMAHDLALRDLLLLDAGDRFLADADAPWRRNLAKQYLLTIPKLDEILWWLPPQYELLVEIAVEGLQAPGCFRRFLYRIAEILGTPLVPGRSAVAFPSLPTAVEFHTIAPAIPLWLWFEGGQNELPGWDAMSAAGVKGIVLPFACALERQNSGCLRPTALLQECMAHSEISIVISCTPESPLLEASQVLDELALPSVLSSPYIDQLLDHLRVPRFVLRESFSGMTPDQARWKFGFARIDNEETRIYQDDGFHIDIIEGTHYSGGAAVSVFPLVGNFSIEVDFTATNPHLADTMELAVINMSGNRHHTEVRYVDRFDEAFDTHASPPFVCVENDEADGFRIMNNQGSSTWTNRYHRDVGAPACPKGSLRLDRIGGHFTGYYKDENHQTWVGCGSAVNYSLNPAVFLRLGAKHWPKGVPPLPANHVIFRNLEVRLYTDNGF